MRQWGVITHDRTGEIIGGPVEYLDSMIELEAVRLICCHFKANAVGKFHR